ncbi:hypothetical protein ACQ4PT_005985 [Festuca glaucescens]
MGSASEAAESNGKQLESPLLTSLQPASAGSGSGSDDGHGHGAGKQLESILNDESVPWGRRMSAATVVEMRMLLRLAAPAVLVYMINYLMSMSTQIFSGHLGTLELAAASLGNTGIQVFAYGLMHIDRINQHSAASNNQLTNSAMRCSLAWEARWRPCAGRRTAPTSSTCWASTCSAPPSCSWPPASLSPSSTSSPGPSSSSSASRRRSPAPPPSSSTASSRRSSPTRPTSPSRSSCSRRASWRPAPTSPPPRSPSTSSSATSSSTSSGWASWAPRSCSASAGGSSSSRSSSTSSPAAGAASRGPGSPCRPSPVCRSSLSCPLRLRSCSASRPGTFRYSCSLLASSRTQKWPSPRSQSA